MKVLITYPPLAKDKGVALLSQNRQFQYFKEPTYIYPVVPAQAATLLKRSGFQVSWKDCIAQGLNEEDFFKFLQNEDFDLIAFETKTPVIKQHWKIIDKIKGQSPNHTSGKTLAGTVPRVALFGDHVTAIPEESFQNSQVDFVLTGGDYDFLLKNLLSSLGSGDGHLKAESLEPGIYYRVNGQIKNSGKFQLDHDLDSLPFIDRDLTEWQRYAQNNGNYKRIPGTYIMSGRDCWWGKCSFCSWPTLYPKFRVRSVENVLDEIEMLVLKYNIREVMDDTGAFPVGDWLRDFCRGMIKRGLDKKVYLDCNMRFGALTPDDFSLMKKANMRLLLFGLESANQNTLDRINKQLKVEQIVEDCKLASKAGLYPHITIMFGYPWETYEEASKTLNLGKWLLKKGYAYTMQATVVIPYPGTPLFQECKEKGWLDTLNWDDYDMKHPVMRTPIHDEKMMQLVQGMYRVSFQPEFILRKLFSLKDADDLKYYLRVLRKVSGHIFDFTKR